MNRLDLEGRVAVITGGAQGIGYAVAERMLASGASVALWDVDRQAQARESLAALGQVATQVVEITDEASVDAATQATLARFGRLDILVNNAGITGGNGDLGTAPDVWRRVIEVNLTALPLLPHRRSAHDQNGLRPHRQHRLGRRQGRQPERRALQRVEGRADRLTKSLGKELAKTGVLVNAVTPAAAKTADLRLDEAGAHRLHAVEDPDGALRRRRGRVDDRLARERGLRVQHRRGLRPSGGRATY